MDKWTGHFSPAHPSSHALVSCLCFGGETGCVLGGQGHKCYHVPGAGPVKTCKSEQYYNLLLPKSLELPFKNACRARSSQATMWVLLASCQHQEKIWKTKLKPLLFSHLLPPSGQCNFYTCAQSSLTFVWLFVEEWTVALQALLSMGFSRTADAGCVAIPSSRGTLQPRDRTHISYVSCTTRQAGSQVLYH